MKKLLFFSALCAFLLCGCSESSTNSSSGLQKSNFFAMDTSIEFNIYGDASLLKEAQNVLTDLESEFLSRILTVKFIRSIRMEPVH